MLSVGADLVFALQAAPIAMFCGDLRDPAERLLKEDLEKQGWQFPASPSAESIRLVVGTGETRVCGFIYWVFFALI